MRQFINEKKKNFYLTAINLIVLNSTHVYIRFYRFNCYDIRTLRTASKYAVISNLIFFCYRYILVTNSIQSYIPFLVARQQRAHSILAIL